jgi:UDP-N-acetylglucosamine--N-acetylmuramyl-(pentapeptide) pyrophosphoryl-undecaprenol N-acetylglucosamine transferase
MRILISGGGTGGHIYPALAVARELRRKFDVELLYLGDANGLETKIVPPEGIPFVTVQAGRLRRYLSAGTLTDLARIPVGIAQALQVVRKFKPDAAFTSGGYVSVPAGYAARLNHAPLIMHQQDVPPNLANRLLTPIATRITVSFPASARYFPQKRTELIGNPVRDEILQAAQASPFAAKAALQLDPGIPVLLVTGGSQGARHLNQTVTAALPDLLSQCQVVHVSGEYTLEETRAAAEPFLSAHPELRARYALHAYLHDEMATALAAADVVLCRSGAATLAELSALGRASILVPLPPGFTGSPQAVNAQAFVGVGAAVSVLDKDLTPEALTSLLFPLLSDSSRREQMATAARTLAQPHAAAKLADLVAWHAWKRITT